ncbi:hypothetical protein BQ8482_280017 [Mesorhizobium delmotii]|uniref:Uncharacterized protein n=1 Tax=Mesorhizobium delmotii TaxID=1631247 RepID=A0A2P9AMD8_9HYPH|nr:hypothetical protein BQ8482_280017 [Mesorhizobium delmotii]
MAAALRMVAFAEAASTVAGSRRRGAARSSSLDHDKIMQIAGAASMLQLSEVMLSEGGSIRRPPELPLPRVFPGWGSLVSPA